MCYMLQLRAVLSNPAIHTYKVTALGYSIFQHCCMLPIAAKMSCIAFILLCVWCRRATAMLITPLYKNSIAVNSELPKKILLV